MRDIKFRAWDRGACEWVNDVLITAGKYNFIYQNYNKCEFCGEDRDIVLVQYTDLKDKNGKEIYEGDIVRHYVGDKFIGLGQIVFGNHNVGADSWGIPLNCQGFFIQWSGQDSHTALDDGKDNQVIGNIYENPELLSTP